MSKSSAHPKDVGRKPATVRFANDFETERAEHVDPHDGYLFAIVDGQTFYWPWHIVEEVRRDV